MENSAFEQLKREYRHMELNRKAYADESHQVKRRRRRARARAEASPRSHARRALLARPRSPAHQVLRKQQINIEKLRRDNEALKTEMAMEMRNHASTKPIKHTDNITKLHDEADRYTQYVEMEKRNIKVMEEQITLIQAAIVMTPPFP